LCRRYVSIRRFEEEMFEQQGQMRESDEHINDEENAENEKFVFLFIRNDFTSSRTRRRSTTSTLVRS